MSAAVSVTPGAMLPNLEAAKANTIAVVEQAQDSSSSGVLEVEDWPYACGFQVDAEQREPVELEVKGTIPAYAAGTIYRAAPSISKVETDSGRAFKIDHWFDGLSIVHRFRLQTRESAPASLQVWYNSRRTVDELIEKIRKTGRMDGFTFANKRDPCESFFHKAMSVFKPPRPNLAKGSSIINIGVTFTANMPGIPAAPRPNPHSTEIDSLITTTDSSTYQKIDPDTLEPYGFCNMEKLHPELKGDLAAAHAQKDPLTGDVFNFNLEFGPTSTYRVFRASPATGMVDILAKFSAPPAYIHSLFLTPSTVILCVWNCRFTMSGVSVLLKQNILDSLAMKDVEPAQWFVIDRTAARRGVIATYTSDPFFCFHTMNAYEERSSKNPDDIDIIADLAAYEDMSIIHGFYYSVLVPERRVSESYKDKYPKSKAYFARYRLPAVPLKAEATSKAPRRAECVVKAPSDISPELPSINPRFFTKRHRFVYGVRSGDRSAFLDGLLKYDTQTDTAITWSERGQTPGEVVFIADPSKVEEDAGVLLSVVLDGFRERSYLLCLDARTMKELGRAEVPNLIAHGLHNLHIPEQR